VPEATGQAFDEELALRIDVTRWVLSHGRVDRMRPSGILTPENPQGQRVDGITPRTFLPRPGGPTILDVIAAQPNPMRIDLDLTADGSRPRDPRAPSALVTAGAAIPSGFTLVVAQLRPDVAGPVSTHWWPLVPRFGSGNYYATVTIPNPVDPGAPLIRRGQELYTQKHFEDYEANSVIYEAPDIGNVIVESGMEGGTSLLRATGYLSRRDLAPSPRVRPFAQRNTPPSRRVGWADPLELELTERRQAPLDRDRDGVPDGTRIWIRTTLPNTFEPVGTRWLRVAAEANSGTRIFDVPAAVEFTVDLPLGPPRPFQQPDRTVKLSVVATSLGFGVPAGPTSPFLVQFGPDQVASGRQSVGLDTFHSRGITLGDTLVIQVKAEDKVACANLSGRWHMGGPYNVGQATSISQQGNGLQFTDERGGRSRGVCRPDGTVAALDWGNLIGRVSPRADRIDWANGAWWLRGERVSAGVQGVTTASWAGGWACAGPGNPHLTIRGGGQASTLSAAYARAHGGKPASETFTIEALSGDAASGRYVYRDASPARGPTGQAGVWTGTWRIRVDGARLLLTRRDEASGWSGSYTCQAAADRRPSEVAQPRIPPTAPDQDYVVWLHPGELTCCPYDTKGEPVYAYHGTTADRVKAGAIVLGRFRSQEEMKRWVCNRQINAHYWERTAAKIGNYHVTRLPCTPSPR
jgi:hypothetical protein